MTAVAGIVCRPFNVRHWVDTRSAPTLGTRGFEHRSLTQPFQLSTKVGHTKGGVAGGIPPHKGGPKARPPNSSEQGSVTGVQR